MPRKKKNAEAGVSADAAQECANAAGGEVNPNWLKKYKAPKTDEEVKESIKSFDPYCQVAYKAIVLKHLFGIDWDKAKEEAKLFGEDSDDAFFEHVNHLNTIIGIKSPDEN